jgi:hypothetical protein
VVGVPAVTPTALVEAVTTLGAIPRFVLPIVIALFDEFTKSATLAEIDQPCLDTIRSSVTVTFGNVPVVVDLFSTKVGAPNVAVALAGTPSERVPSCADVVVADNATDPELDGVGLGVATGAASFAAAV